MNNCQYYHPYLNCRAEVMCKVAKENYKGEKLRQMLERLHFDVEKCLNCEKFKGKD